MEVMVSALGVGSDIRAGWRTFFRNRRAWGVASLLGLAIGASAAFLGFIDAALRHPVRGVDEVDRVIVLGGIAQGASVGGSARMVEGSTDRTSRAIPRRGRPRRFGRGGAMDPGRRSIRGVLPCLCSAAARGA